MGLSYSSDSLSNNLIGLSNRMNDELKLLISDQPLPEPLDKFMETLLFSLDFGENSNHNYIYHLLQELSKKIAINNVKSKNFARLLVHFIGKLNALGQELNTLVSSNISLSTLINESIVKNGNAQSNNSNNNAGNQNNQNNNNGKPSGDASSKTLDQSIQLMLYNHQQYLINYTILLQSFTKYFIETMTIETLQIQFNNVINQNNQQDSNSSDDSLSIELLSSIIKFLAIEPNDYTYDLYIVLLNFLIILFSTEMYLPLPTQEVLGGSNEDHYQIEEQLSSNLNIRQKEDETTMTIYKQSPNIFINTIMRIVEKKLLPSSIINQFITNLYNNIIYKTPRPSSNTSLLNSIGNAASYLLLIPWNTYKYFYPNNVHSESTLADISLLTLLTLIQYYNPPSNPFRLINHTIQDKDFLETQQNSNINISMSKLYQHIIKSPSSDSNILLLYYLLLDNPYFFKYVQSRTDIDNLVLPILQVLYNQFEAKPQQSYMIIIIILILTQDNLFNSNVHSLILHQVLWYKERHLVDISLGGLLLVILIKSIMLNLTKLRDASLHTNCLAIFANLSSSLTHIHPYVSTRIVKLLEVLSKRYMKLLKLPTPNILDNSFIDNNTSFDLSMIDKTSTSSTILHRSPSSTTLVDSNTDELQTHIDFIYIILQIINNTLTYRANQNPHLIYSLLLQHDYLHGFSNDETLSDLALNIINILSFFANELQGISTQEWTAQKILSFIETKSKSITIPPTDNQTNSLRFKYEEESNSFEFITPYVWSLIFSYSGQKWDVTNMTLFHNSNQNNQNNQNNNNNSNNNNQNNNNGVSIQNNNMTGIIQPPTTQNNNSANSQLPNMGLLSPIQPTVYSTFNPYAGPIIIEGLNDNSGGDNSSENGGSEKQTTSNKRVSIT